MHDMNTMQEVTGMAKTARVQAYTSFSQSLGLHILL